MITLITCTGQRPETFKLCDKFVERMCPPVIGKYQWIIVDDGDTDSHIPVNSPVKVEYHKGPRPWKPGFNTQRFNMELALSKVKGDYIFVIEDDDYYSPDYIRRFLEVLKVVDVAGQSNNRYYSVATPGYKNMHNYAHSSLCSTAFTRKALPLMNEAVDSGELYFDITFWSKVRSAGLSHALLANTNLCIGMKGLPGREGIGIGHRQKDYHYDHNLVKLTEWIGGDAEMYRPFIGGKRATDKKREQNP